MTRPPLEGPVPGAAPADVLADAADAAEDWHAAWASALDRLELDVELAEAMLRSNEAAAPLRAWQPPAMRVPLPSDLVPRARLLHERQLAVAHGISQRVFTTAKQRAYAGKVRDIIPPSVPVYVDVSA